MITHDHELIFIHIPKTGGRSVCEAFNQRFDHFTLAHYHREYRGRIFQTYRKFCIVRHPLERMVSSYHYIKEHRRHPFEPIGHCDKTPGNIPDFSTWLTFHLVNFKGSFDTHSPEGGRGRDWEEGSSHWFSSQARRISIEKEIPSDLVRFRFELGFEPIEQWLGMKLPHQNKSTHKPWQEYFNEPLLYLCRSFGSFREDAEMFGYKLEI